MNTPVRLTSEVTSSSATVLHTPAFSEAVARVADDQTLPALIRRPATSEERLQLDHELMAMHHRAAERLLRRRRGDSTTEQVLNILRDASQQVGTTAFDDRSAMAHHRGVIDAAVREGRPLPMVLLLGGDKAASPLKTLHYTRPDASEDLAMARLAAIATAVQEVHSPGAVVVPLPDAQLHTADLGVAASSAHLHQEAQRQRLRELDLSSQVVVLDTLELLPADWPAEVRRRMVDARARAREDRKAQDKAWRQAQSLRMSLNTSIFGLSLEEEVRMMAAMQRPAGSPHQARLHAELVARHVDRVVWHYIGVNHAIRTRDLAGEAAMRLTGSSAHVRMSVHAKPGEPRPVLGPMKSNRYTRPGLLPMHGLAYREVRDGRVRWGMQFGIEAVMRGLVAVEDDSGHLLYLEPAGGAA